MIWIVNRTPFNNFFSSVSLNSRPFVLGFENKKWANLVQNSSNSNIKLKIEREFIDDLTPKINQSLNYEEYKLSPKSITWSPNSRVWIEKVERKKEVVPVLVEEIDYEKFSNLPLLNMGIIQIYDLVKEYNCAFEFRSHIIDPINDTKLSVINLENLINLS